MGKNLDRLKQAYALGTPGIAQTLGAMGRGNDSLVAHITPEEAMLLKQRGGAGTINPRTGLLEFYDSDGGGNASDGGNPTGGDSGGGSEGNNDGWGGGDWGGNVDFGGWEGWGAPSAPSTPGLGFAGDDPNSGMANIFGNSAPGLGFAGDNADYGMANIIGDSTANITSNADGGNDGYNNAPGNYDGNTYVPPVFTEPPTTTAPPATTTPSTGGTTPSTGGTTPSTGGTTTGGTTTTPATPGTFQFAAPVSPAFYGFELNRLMRQYGVPAPTIMPYGGAAASTAQADAAKAAYDQNVYQNYVNEYQNRLANTNMYNMAQFTPNPANFRQQYAAPIANPTYAPANYGGIADVYSKYFGRQPEQAGVEYWGKTGLTGDALQKAITSGAQNMDLEYLRKNYPNMGFARGGYAEGGETETPATEGERPERSTSEPMTPDQARRYRELMTRYLPSTNYGPQLAAAQQTARSEADAFSNMIRQMSERAESPTSRAEMYFRLASAFGAPTRTGQFTENLALAGREMGEYAKGRRADEAERRALGLRAQELRMAGARQDLATLQALAGQESAERRAILPRIIEAEVRANTPNARQSRIADIMRIHDVDERIASGIADGILNVVTDPVTGMSQIVNRATGESRPVVPRSTGAPTPSTGGAAPPAAPPGTPAPAAGAPRGPAGESARPERTLYELASVPRTTGVLPAIGEGAQRVAGQVGANVVPAEFTERRQAFLNVQNEIIRAVINNPRFPVAEQERIRRELNIEPSMLTDPQTLLARIRALDSTLRTSLANREREGADTSLPVDARRGALQAANEARNLLQILGVPQEREEPAPRPQRRGTLRPQAQVPRVGQVVDGYTFLGGDPSDQNNWSRE